MTHKLILSIFLLFTVTGMAQHSQYASMTLTNYKSGTTLVTATTRFDATWDPTNCKNKTKYKKSVKNASGGFDLVYNTDYAYNAYGVTDVWESGPTATVGQLIKKNWTQTTYDAQGRKVSMVAKKWNAASSTYVNSSSTTFFYTGNSANADYSTQSIYNLNTSRYELASKTIYTYYLDGKKKSQEYQTYDPTTTNYTPASRDEMTYDPNTGKILSDIYSYYDNASKSMLPNTKYDYTYANGNQTKMVTSSRDTNGTGWNVYQTVDYTYTGNDLKDVTYRNRVGANDEIIAKEVYTPGTCTYP
jgi:hypothetical protein